MPPKPIPHEPNDHLPPRLRCANPRCDGGFVTICHSVKIEGDSWVEQVTRLRCGQCDGTGQKRGGGDLLRRIINHRQGEE